MKENKENKEKKKHPDLFLGIVLGALANIRNVLYVFATCLGGYLFYQAIQLDNVMAMFCSLGFLFISYLPIWKKG